MSNNGIAIGIIVCIIISVFVAGAIYMSLSLQSQNSQAQENLKVGTYTGVLDHISYVQGVKADAQKPKIQECYVPVIIVPHVPSSGGYYSSRVSATQLFFVDGQVFQISGYYSLSTGLTYRLTFTYRINGNGDTIINQVTQIELLQEGQP